MTMNLFWQTRHLTSAREDHLTCFVAAALEADAGFRAAYQARVLGPLAQGGPLPTITQITTQASFAEQRSQPDMVLGLDDGRRVVCEHKLEAAETAQEGAEGRVLQLERYLALPGVDAVAYFRASLKAPQEAVLAHPRYLRPEDAPHFLWRDLYEPLMAGQHVLSAWLRDGFQRLGLTPALPHVGALYPNDDPQVKERQLNFGKLWHPTRSHLSEHWKIESASRCELYLTAKGDAIARLVYISPLAQGATLLRLRISKFDDTPEALAQRLKPIATALPVPAEMVVAKAGDGSPCLDLLVSLHLLLAGTVDTADQETRLFAQVVPIVDGLATRA